jgi:membrane associated rhomboid family serine protease
MMRREQWHLTEGLLFAHFAVFFLTTTSDGTFEALALIPRHFRSEPWRAVTFQFLHGGMLSFFFSMIVLWIMARPLEESWGSPRFLVFWLISVLGAAGTALLFGQPLVGDIFLSTSLLFTFASLSPDTEFLLFLVLPVKVKWLAIFGGAVLLFSSFATLGPLGGIANAVGMSAGYVYFLATRRLPTRRKLVFQMKKARGKIKATVEDATVERRNLDWDPSVREAEERLRSGQAMDDQTRQLLVQLDDARDPSITVCGPSDFGHTDDPVCRTCPGFPECAARAIRMAEEEAKGK